MSEKSPLIIDRPITSGEQFQHDGSIIFKTFVPDGVQATALDGGILLEQGGGDNLTLVAKRAPTQPGQNTYINHGAVISTGAGSFSMAGGRIFVNGQEITNTFNSPSAQPQITGVTAKAALGTAVTITAQGSVTLQKTGDNLKVTASGSLTAADLGNGAVINAAGSITAGGIGPNAKVDAGGSLTVTSLGDKSVYNIGGNAKAETIGAQTMLSAGGSITAGLVRPDARLNAGGSIKIDQADASVSAKAGGLVKIGGHKIGGFGMDF